MSKAEELRKMTENYWSSSEVMQQVENAYQEIVTACTDVAKRGRLDCNIPDNLHINATVLRMVIDKLKAEGFAVYWDECIDDWVIGW